MPNPYSRVYQVKWADVDPNGHIRHTIYGDFAVDVRVHFMAEHGFSLERLREQGIGPVILRDETAYRREVRMAETVTVDMKLAGLSPDGSHWIFEHQVFKADGKKAAVLRVEGGWLDLGRRTLVVPPAEFGRLTGALERTADFTELSTYIKR